MTAALSAADVVSAVRRHYGADRDGIGPEWGVLDEFSLAPGAGHQRIDLFAVRAWSGRPKGHERHAIEVKVSRSDLRNELARLGKAAPFEAVSHRFFLAVPAGLLRDDDPVPAHWGIYEVRRRGSTFTCRRTRQAERRDSPEDLGERASVEAFRRASRAEARIRAASEVADDDPARIPALEKQLAAAQRAEVNAKAATRRERDRLRNLLSEISSVGGWVCVCGAPIGRTPDRYGAAMHADGSPCAHARYGGRATYDYGALAVALGLTTASDESADDPLGVAGLRDPNGPSRLERALAVLASEEAASDEE